MKRKMTFWHNAREFLFFTSLSVFVATHTAAQECDYETGSLNRYQIKDSVVIDKKTGLMWARCSLGQYWSGRTCIGTPRNVNWWIAHVEAKRAKIQGYSNWRLPTIDELRTLDEEACRDPAINLTVFPNTPPYSYWSTTPSHRKGLIQLFAFTYGFSHSNIKSIEVPVRLVREVR